MADWAIGIVFIRGQKFVYIPKWMLIQSQTAVYVSQSDQSCEPSRRPSSTLCVLSGCTTTQGLSYIQALQGILQLKCIKQMQGCISCL